MADKSTLFALGLLALAGCAPVARPRPPAAHAAPDVPQADLRELATRLPAPSLRCVVLAPSQLAMRQRPLIAPLSQASELPWLLSLPVVAYAASESEAPAGTRELVELVRFAEGTPEQIRHELTRTDRRMLRWDSGVSMLCGGEPGCIEVDAGFVDPRTVQLRSQGAASLDSTATRSCLSELDEQPGALEVAVRGGSALGGTRLETISTLTLQGDAVQRLLRHHYQDGASAERAAARLASGEEEAPTLGASLVEARAERHGEWLSQRARVSFEELLLAAEDQQRLRRAVAVSVEQDLSTEPPASDAEAVRRYYDAISGKSSPGRSWTELDQLLARAWQQHPEDDGLARRLYQLRLLQLRSPAGALEVAEQAAAQPEADEASWQLARRRALLELDPKRLRAAVQRSFALNAVQAGQLAEELARKVQAGGDYERAEWAFLTARSMCQRVEKQGRAPLLGATRVPLSELPRMLTYLARLPSEREVDLGVHIVARGSTDAAATSSVQTWSERTVACGHGHVLAAASFDDGQLLAQGALLATLFPAGDLELYIGIDPLGAARASHGATVRLRGTVADGVLTLNEVSRPLRDVRWALLERTLLAPLASLRGALFPPDEWSFELISAGQAVEALAAAQTEPSAQCERDGTRVHCRGSFSDARVAARALRRAAAVVLHKEARALWSSAEAAGPP